MAALGRRIRILDGVGLTSLEARKGRRHLKVGTLVAHIARNALGNLECVGARGESCVYASRMAIFYVVRIGG